MAGRMRKSAPTRRDAVDAARLKLQGDPSHINAREDRLLRETMPEAHGRVVTRGLLAEAGRGRDDRVTLLIPAEAALLRSRGGSGAVNPRTGLLEYDDSDDDGNSGNTSNAGENTGGMDGTADSGVSDGPGANGGYGSNDGGYGGLGGYGAYSGGPYGGGRRSGGLGGPAFSGKLESQPYDPTRTPIESLLAAPNFAMPGVSFTQYAPRDTFGRAWQEWMDPHPAAMRATPGRYGMPNAMGPGIVGTAINSFVGGPFGGPFSAMMGIGAAMGRAQSMEQQDASIAHNQAQGAKNSSGNQANTHGLFDARDAARKAGEQSGAQTAELPQPPPGYTINPAGQIVPIGGQDRDRAANPVQNLLYDYIWRGRVGSGWGW